MLRGRQRREGNRESCVYNLKVTSSNDDLVCYIAIEPVGILSIIICGPNHVKL